MKGGGKNPRTRTPQEGKGNSITVGVRLGEKKGRVSLLRGKKKGKCRRFRMKREEIPVY